MPRKTFTQIDDELYDERRRQHHANRMRVTVLEDDPALDRNAEMRRQKAKREREHHKMVRSMRVQHGRRRKP